MKTRPNFDVQYDYRKWWPCLGEDGHHAADEGPAEEKAEPVIDR